jgi:hypothetical protein
MRRDRNAHLKSAATYQEKISRRGSLEAIKEMSASLANRYDVKNIRELYSDEPSLDLDLESIENDLDQLIWSTDAIASNSYKNTDDKVSYFNSRFYMLNIVRTKILPAIEHLSDAKQLKVDEWVRYVKDNVDTKKLRDSMIAANAQYIATDITDHFMHGKASAFVQIGHIVEKNANVPMYDRELPMDKELCHKRMSSDALSKAVYTSFIRDEIYKGFGELDESDLAFMEGRRTMYREFNLMQLENAIIDLNTEAVSA